VARAFIGRLDLLLTDVVLPRGNGVMIAAALLADRPGLKVIFTSGNTEQARVIMGHVGAGIAMLSKPFAPAVLVRAVAQVLGG
jgi:DNA-binding response OmpR family regulator